MAYRSWCFPCSKAAVLPRFCAGVGGIRSSANQIKRQQGRQGHAGRLIANGFAAPHGWRNRGVAQEFGGLGTGRASASLLEAVIVSAYGGAMPINQLPNVSVPEPRMITVQVWDRAMVKAVDKAIREAGLGLNPQTEGQVIRVPIPDLNEERRRELTRVSAKYAEQARVSVRNVRRDGIEVPRAREKGAEISQDEQRKLQHEIQNLTDDYIRRIDDALAQKDKEILQV